MSIRPARRSYRECRVRQVEEDGVTELGLLTLHDFFGIEEWEQEGPAFGDGVAEADEQMFFGGGA